jgi:uncharacterized protein YjbI with pentapeptide repeats
MYNQLIMRAAKASQPSFNGLQVFQHQLLPLPEALLSEALLSEALLSEALLSEALLSEALLFEALLFEALLSEALLSEALLPSPLMGTNVGGCFDNAEGYALRYLILMHRTSGHGPRIPLAKHHNASISQAQPSVTADTVMDAFRCSR